MTQCTKCNRVQNKKNEVGQPAIFCEICGGSVEVVSDELPFDDLLGALDKLEQVMQERQIILDSIKLMLQDKINEETNTNTPPGVGGMQ